MALDITAINLTVQQATGGIVGHALRAATRCTSSSTPRRSRTTSTRRARRTSGSTSGTTSPAGREALITVAFTFSYTDEDDNKYTYSKSLQVKVAP